MSEPEVKVTSDIGTVAEAAGDLFKLFTAAIPPPQVRIDKATAKLPFLKALAEWRVKRLHARELEHWVKAVKKGGYDPLKYVQMVESHPTATPLDSLQAFLIQEKLEKK